MAEQQRLGEFLGENRGGDDNELVLPEHRVVARENIPYEVGEYLHSNYNTEVDVTFPSPKTDGSWEFKNEGYAGRLELIDGWSVSLKPKVEIESVFRMLEEVYEIESFQILEGITDAQSVNDIFHRVVNILAKKIANRNREGLYKSYVSRNERSNSIRGRIDIRQAASRPWDPKLPIQYDELTADNEENQILLWTIFQALSVGIEHPETQNQAREVFRSLANEISLTRFGEKDCINRNYGRDNHDYELLHSLCRIILANMGPTVNRGDTRVVPFRVEMASLFENFVAKKLEENLPKELELTTQYKCPLDDDRSWIIDLVVHNGPVEEGNVLFIADTKYSTPNSTSKLLPRPSSLSQVVSYATALDIDQAYLLYPVSIETEFNQLIGDVRVRTLHFDAEQNFDHSIRSLLRSIFLGLGMPDLAP